MTSPDDYMTHYVGDNCPGGHRDVTSTVSSAKALEAARKFCANHHKIPNWRTEDVVPCSFSKTPCELQPQLAAALDAFANTAAVEVEASFKNQMENLNYHRERAEKAEAVLQEIVQADRENDHSLGGEWEGGFSAAAEYARRYFQEARRE